MLKYLGALLACLTLSVTLLACDNGNSATKKTTKLPSDQRLAELYQQSCKGCHTRKSSGAPQAHHAQAWQTRLNKGMGQLLDNTKFGYRAMPPEGLCRSCSDDDFRQLIEFMAAE